MIKDKIITIDDINWFVDNCVVNNMEGFTHLCIDCPIKTECKEIWGNLWGVLGEE